MAYRPSEKKATKKKVSTAATAAKRAGKKKKSKQAVAIEDRQWKLPASYYAGGKSLATLREVVDPDVPTMSFSELSARQRVDLVAKRIAQQPKFQIAMLGAGLLDQKRAIAEVQGQTSIGRALMEIEQRVINHQVAKAAQTESTKPAKAGKKAKKKNPR